MSLVTSVTGDHRKGSMTAITDRIAGRTVASGFLDAVAERGDDVALRWKDGDDWQRVDLRRVRRPGRPGRRRPAGPGRRARRPRRADDAQHPRVPRARPGRPHVRRHAHLDLQLVVPRAGRVPGRPLRGRASASSRTTASWPASSRSGPAPGPAVARRAQARAEAARLHLGRPPGRRAHRPRRGRRRRRPRATWPPSSTPRAPPGRPRA